VVLQYNDREATMFTLLVLRDNVPGELTGRQAGRQAGNKTGKKGESSSSIRSIVVI